MDDLLFQLPLFWDKAMILCFFEKLSEILEQSNKKAIISIIEDLNTCSNFNRVTSANIPPEIFKTPKPSGKRATITRELFLVGWLDLKIDDFKTISEFLYLTDRSYHGYAITEMVRAIRNLNIHKNETKVNLYDKKEQGTAQSLKQKITKIHIDGYIDFWLTHFPELLLTVYKVVASHLEKLRKDDDLTVFANHYFPLAIIDITKIPSSLTEFKQMFSEDTNYSEYEQRENWLYSVKVQNGPVINFYRYHVANKFIFSHELVTMTLTVTENGRQVENSSLVHLDIDRKASESNGETKNRKQVENSSLVNLDIKRKASESNGGMDVLFLPETSKGLFKDHCTIDQRLLSELKLKFTDCNSSNDKSEPLYIFSENIVSALVESGQQGHIESHIVFTGKRFEEIEAIVQKFYKFTENEFDVKMGWNNLSTSFKDQLLQKPYFIHNDSTEKTKLKCVLAFENEIDHDIEPVEQEQREIKTKQLACITLKQINPCGAEFINLLHKPHLELLPTGIPNYNNPYYQNRCLDQVMTSGVKNTSTLFKSEQAFVKNLIDGDIENCNRLTVIHAIPGMGKSTLLAALGWSFSKKNLVCFREANVLLPKDYSLTNMPNIIPLLWPKSKLQQTVAENFIKFAKKLFLLIDGFSEVSDANQKLIISFVERALESMEGLNVLIATRNSCLKSMLNRTTRRIDVFSIVPLNDDDIKDLVSQSFNSFLSQTNKQISAIKLDNYIENSVDQITKLGEIARTPFACNMMVMHYKKYLSVENLPKRHQKDQIIHIYDTFINSHVNNYLIRQCSKSQTPPIIDTPTFFLDTTSLYFKANKNVLMWPYTKQAIEQKFTKDIIDIQEISFIVDLFCISSDNSEFDNNEFLRGPLIDYFIAWFVDNCLNLKSTEPLCKRICEFFCKSLLLLTTKNNTVYFEYNDILTSLNFLIDISKMSKVFAIGGQPNNIKEIVFMALCHEHDRLFTCSVKSLDYYKLASQYSTQSISYFNNFREETYATCVFHKAIIENDVMVVNYFLIHTNINVNLQNPINGYTSLHCVFSPLNEYYGQNDQNDLIRQLIDKNAKVEIENSKHENCLEMALGIATISEDTIKALISPKNRHIFKDNWLEWRKKISEKFQGCLEYFEDQMKEIEHGTVIIVSTNYQ